MKPRTLFTAFLTAGTMCLFIATQAAAVTVYTGEDTAPGATLPPGGNADTAYQDFINALTGGYSTETLESFADGDTAPLSLTTISGTLSGAGEIESVVEFGMFPISGDDYWQVAGNYEITFDSPVSAFGFFATDIGDHNGDLDVEIDGVGYAIPHSKITAGPFGSTDFNVLFWGIIDPDNSFTTVTFLNSNPNADTFGFDNFTTGTLRATPLPAALPLLLTALSALGLLGWRRRATT